jgi:hypothetical protein
VSAQVADFRTHEVVFHVDFDLLDDDGCAWASMRFRRGPGPPEPGDVVYLMDGAGRGCVGSVESVEGWYVRVSPDWGTWIGDPLPSAAA